RRNTVVFIGRHEPRKGLDVLMRAWPEIRRRTGARLRVIGAEPRAVRLSMGRHGVRDEGIDLLGVVVGEPLTAELAAAKLLAALSRYLRATSPLPRSLRPARDLRICTPVPRPCLPPIRAPR